MNNTSTRAEVVAFGTACARQKCLRGYFTLAAAWGHLSDQQCRALARKLEKSLELSLLQ